MSHTPPVPQGNQSPYPLKEPPHAHHEAKLPPRASHEGDQSVIDQLRALPLVAVGAAIGLGAALIGGAAYAFTRDSGAKSRGKGRKKRG